MKQAIFTIWLYLFCLAGFSQAWVLENPYPTYQHLFAVDFPSASIGYIAGDNGTLLKTTDGGTTWKQVNVPGYFYNSQIRNVTFVDNEKGFIAQGKKVYRTLNGGQSWSASVQLNVGTLQGTHFIDQNTGFAFGCYESIAKTTDGGTTWNAITYSPMVELHYSYLDFADHSIGYVVAQDWYFEEAVLQRTDDGGLSWSNLIVPDEIEYISGLEVINANNIWIGAGNAFWNPQTGYSAKAYHTTDGGITWSTHILGATNTNTGGVLDIRFFDQNEGRIVNLNHIYTTHDGGETWSDRLVGAGACVSCFTPASWTDESTVFMAGYSPALIYTNDCGETFQDLISGGTPMFWTTYFKDTLHGFVGGSYNDDAMIRFTDNGGILWQEAAVESLPGEVVTDIVFSNSTTGWAFYEDGLLKSVDGGYSWTIQPSANFSMTYKNASCPSSSAFYVAGVNNGLGGKVYKSTDQGNTWAEAFAGVASYYKDNGFQFTDTQTGYMALKPITTEYPGKLLKTVDGGTNWSDLSYGEQSEITSLSFSGNQNGMISLANNKILFTQNGGETWTASGTQFPAAVTYVRLFDHYNGVAAIKGQYLYHTSNGGATFEEVYHGTTIWPYSSSNAFFIDQDHGWASGFQGMIMRYNATWTSTNSPTGKITNHKVSTLNIYPNPSNGSIHLTSEASGALTIYSIDGIKVMNNNFIQGSEINISHLPKGLYLVTLSGKEGVKVGRFVKL